VLEIKVISLGNINIKGLEPAKRRPLTARLADDHYWNPRAKRVWVG